MEPSAETPKRHVHQVASASTPPSASVCAAAPTTEPPMIGVRSPSAAAIVGASKSPSITNRRPAIRSVCARYEEFRYPVSYVERPTPDGISNAPLREMERSRFPTLLFFIVLAAGVIPAALHVRNASDHERIDDDRHNSRRTRRRIGNSHRAPWERALVLRLGKFRALRGPGLFFIIPIIDTVPYWIDTRVNHALVQGREDADARHRARRRRRGAVLEGRSIPQKAALAVADYTSAIKLGGADRTARRDRQDDARRHARRPRKDLAASCSGSSTSGPSRGAST